MDITAHTSQHVTQQGVKNQMAVSSGPTNTAEEMSEIAFE
eukprot:gene16313-4969_t